MRTPVWHIVLFAALVLAKPIFHFVSHEMEESISLSEEEDSCVYCETNTFNSFSFGDAFELTKTIGNHPKPSVLRNVFLHTTTSLKKESRGPPEHV